MNEVKCGACGTVTKRVIGERVQLWPHEAGCPNAMTPNLQTQLADAVAACGGEGYQSREAYYCNSCGQFMCNYPWRKRMSYHCNHKDCYGVAVLKKAPKPLPELLAWIEAWLRERGLSMSVQFTAYFRSERWEAEYTDDDGMIDVHWDVKARADDEQTARALSALEAVGKIGGK